MTETTEDKKPLSIYDLVETDVVAEEDGRWFHDFAGADSGVSFKLRRMMSKKSANARRQIEADFRKYKKNGRFPDAIGDKILAAHLGHGVIIDWRGVYDREGKEIKFSPEAATELMEQLSVLRLNVVTTALDLDNFRTDASEDIAKN